MSLYDRILTEAKLSDAQQRYLIALVKVFARAHKHERERWGGKLEWVNEADVASELGKSADQIVKTGNKVIEAGLAELNAKVHYGSKLRLGAFGKWIGGAKRTTSVSRLVRPTKAGLQRYKLLTGWKKPGGVSEGIEQTRAKAIRRAEFSITSTKVVGNNHVLKIAFHGPPDAAEALHALFVLHGFDVNTQDRKTASVLVPMGREDEFNKLSEKYWKK